MVYRIALNVPAAEQRATMQKDEQYWRHSTQMNVITSSDQVVVAATSAWSTRLVKVAEGLEVIGQTACIPRLVLRPRSGG